MARGQRKSIEDKIREKEELISSLKRRIKNETNELETLYEDKNRRDMECIGQLLKTAHITPEEAMNIIETHINKKISPS
ncbi:hypothetical protein [Acetivibrio ethanolgignens]|uniref:Uncharacterized protein n=1 Tax=Acetivibrio ethanolgignens TaxID=290052 RepID=A0A0V8QH57_9FIRM|nr:hypothetical protein [Acetivibrio ethanolgignens]KSV59892.1 hypothetical protein ASU35_17815 [Acetivibrio ethanolgignens]